MKGLPRSFINAINTSLNALNFQTKSLEIQNNQAESENIIPQQYKGLDADSLDFIWIIPEYVDPKKTEQEKEKKQKALDYLRNQELIAVKNREYLLEIRNKIQETVLPEDIINERIKLSGWSASYELAKIAKQQNIDLATFSREEYVDFAIKNFLAIDDSQLRMPPWQRMCESAQEIVTINKEKRVLINEDADKAFSKFCFEVQKKAGEDNRSIQDRIRVRQGTKDSNSWLFFKVNNGTAEGSKETFKSYVSVKDLNKLTPERFISLMVALRDAGYNGDIKIFQDLAVQGVNLYDQIVMHGASKNDARLALSVAEKFFGDELDQISMGKDEVVDGKNYSYSQILAKKIKDAINSTKNP